MHRIIITFSNAKITSNHMYHFIYGCTTLFMDVLIKTIIQWVCLRNLKQAISAHEWALCQLTMCFEFQSRSEKRKGHKHCALQMVFRSKVPS